MFWGKLMTPDDSYIARDLLYEDLFASLNRFALLETRKSADAGRFLSPPFCWKEPTGGLSPIPRAISAFLSKNFRQS
ncbi:MAG: hypothetical protein WD035_05935 [Balneolaceae bacterium]